MNNKVNNCVSKDCNYKTDNSIHNCIFSILNSSRITARKNISDSTVNKHNHAKNTDYKEHNINCCCENWRVAIKQACWTTIFFLNTFSTAISRLQTTSNFTISGVSWNCCKCSSTNSEYCFTIFFILNYISFLKLYILKLYQIFTILQVF